MNVLFAALGAGIIYLLEKYLYRVCWSRGLSVKLQFQQEILTEGDTGQIEEIITSKKLLPLPMLQVKFYIHKNIQFLGEENISISDQCYKNDVFSVLFYQRIRRILQFKAVKRGYYPIHNVDCISTDLFFAETYARQYESGTALLVLPGEANIRQIDLLFQKVMGTVRTKAFFYEDPFEFYGIRTYQTYDPIRDINWKASAKLGELMINTHAVTARQEVCILLNLEDQGIRIYDNLKEESIRIANSLSSRPIRQGIPVGIISNGRDYITGEECKAVCSAGIHHSFSIAKALARIDLSQKCREFAKLVEERNRDWDQGVMLILISSASYKALEEIFDGIARKYKGSKWILPVNPDLDCPPDLLKNCELYIVEKA